MEKPRYRLLRQRLERNLLVRFAVRKWYVGHFFLWYLLFKGFLALTYLSLFAGDVATVEQVPFLPLAFSLPPFPRSIITLDICD